MERSTRPDRDDGVGFSPILRRRVGMTQHPDRDYDMRREAEAEPSERWQAAEREIKRRTFPVQCPTCGSLIGEKCFTKQGNPRNQHDRRVKLTKMMGG